MNNEKMSQIISQLRKEKKLTQKELADQMGVTDKAVSKWERGLSFPDISLLPKLSEVLGVTVNDLVNAENGISSKPIENVFPNTPVPNNKNAAKGTTRKFILAGLGLIPLTCMILFLSSKAIDLGLSWVLIPVSIIAPLWLISIIGTFVMNKNKIASSLFCGALIFSATYYFASLNQATTRDIAKYGEFNGFQSAYIPHYTIIISMLLVSMVIVLISSGIFKKTISGNAKFLLGATSITLIIIAILTVSSIMDYVDIHGLGVNPTYTILLLLTCLINCISVTILVKQQRTKQ